MHSMTQITIEMDTVRMYAEQNHTKGDDAMNPVPINELNGEHLFAYRPAPRWRHKIPCRLTKIVASTKYITQPHILEHIPGTNQWRGEIIVEESGDDEFVVTYEINECEIVTWEPWDSYSANILSIAARSATAGLSASLGVEDVITNMGKE